MLQIEQLAELVERHRAETHAKVKEFTVQGHPFAFNSEPAIMGVINLSADSWYRGRVCVGAESTLAQAEVAEADLQNSKLLPVVRRLQSAGVVVSVETYQPAVAKACLEAGAGILN